MGIDGKTKFLSAIVLAAVAAGLLAAGACAKKPRPEDAVSGFLKGVKNGNQESVLQAVNLESLFPVYEGERIDVGKTKAVCAEFKDRFARSLAERDKAYWGDGEKEVRQAAPQDDGSFMVTVINVAGTRSANFIVMEPPGSKEKFRIVQIYYQNSKPD